MTTERTLAEVKDDLRRVKAEVRLAEAQAQKKLLESWLGPSLTGSGWGSFVDPADRFRDPDLAPALAAGTLSDRVQGNNGPFLRTEAELEFMRGAARVLAETNPVAIGVLTTLRNFVIRTGFTYRAVVEDGAADPNAAELAGLVQQAVDEFRDRNGFSRREKRAFWRSRRDGEVFWRYFVPDPGDGHTVVRVVEPEQVRWAEGGREWSWGIRTDPDDVEGVLAYAVTHYGQSVPEEVAAAEIDHLKLNVDETVKRGMSDFYATGEALDGTIRLLRCMRVGEGVRAGITGFWQYDAANRAGVQSALDKAAADRAACDPPAGRPQHVTRYEPGTILHVPRGRTFVPPPVSPNALAQASVAQASLRAIGVRWCMPEYMVSGDVSNTPFASNLVAGSPFVNACETEQDEYRDFFLRVVWRAVANYADAGRFRVGGKLYGIDEIKALVDVQAHPPQVAIQDKLERARVKEVELHNRVTSVQQWRGESGYDGEQIRKDLAEEPPVPAPAPERVTARVDATGMSRPVGAGASEGGRGGFFPRLGVQAAT